MNYFLVTVDKNYIAPMPMGWYGILDQKSLKGKKAYQMKDYYLFYVENHMQMVFTDIVTFPCYLVSLLVKEMITCYDPFVKFSRILFYDRQRKQSMAYYLPFFSQVEATIEGKGKEKNIYIRKKQWKNPIILEVTFSLKSFVLMRIDLLESILRRGAIGIGVEEVNILLKEE